MHNKPKIVEHNKTKQNTSAKLYSNYRVDKKRNIFER